MNTNGRDRSVLTASHRLLLRAATTWIAVMIGASLLGGNPNAAQAAPVTAYQIVVLGDSYSSGNGAGSYEGLNSFCRRSTNNYAQQYGRWLAQQTGRPVTVTTEACSAAVTGNYWANSGMRPQRDSLGDTTNLVLMTFGGDDLGFAKLVTNCLMKPGSVKDCATQLKAASKLIRTGTLRNRLVNVLEDIGDLTRRDVKVVLLGYPYLEIDTKLRFGPIQLGKLAHQLEDAAEAQQQQAVATANAVHGTDRFLFVPTKGLFKGTLSWLPTTQRHRHELYKSKRNSSRWMVDPVYDRAVGDMDAYYHPNLTGWTYEAKLLERRLGNRP